jgi:glyoxylase-like metal-dependent hydrolase (beta-lactamase superfamily II)
VEHVGGNAVFGEDPIVIAHELVPARLRSGLYLFHEFPPATFPDITLSDSMTLHFNGERIKIQALAGSHDDNEIVVHFTESKVVHLSSLVNGFNFPSVDEDGDVLAFERLVARAIELLPEDVLIVSGHNDTGTWADLHEYHKMLRETTATVRQGLADGKDLAALQEEAVLDDWQSYAGSYVSVADWTEYLVKGLEGRKEPQKTVFEPLYYTWKEKGAEAAVEHYSELNRKHRDEYRFDEFSLLAIGSKLVSRGLAGDAVTFLRASQAEYPDSTYSYYLNYQLAKAYDELGQQHLAIQHCETALDLNPQFERAADLLRQMKVGSRPES